MQTDPNQALLGFPISRAPRAHLHAPRRLCHRQIPRQGDPRSQPWSPLHQLLGSKSTLCTARFSCLMLQHPRCCPTWATFPPQQADIGQDTPRSELRSEQPDL